MDGLAVRWTVLAKHTLLYAVDTESTKVETHDTVSGGRRLFNMCSEMCQFR